jgi:hypothetical protein
VRSPLVRRSRVRALVGRLRPLLQSEPQALVHGVQVGRAPSLASKIASAKAATEKANETSPKRFWFGRSKVDAAHAVPPPAKMTDAASARTATAIKTDGRKAASSDDYEFEPDDDDRPRKSGSNGRRASDAELEANERRMSKAERKALRRQQRERYEHGDEE